MIKQGQNKISRALIWDKVHLCRPNMTGDMIKNVKTVIFKKCHILHFCSINENPCFFFFIISLVIFGLQRRTLHQIKALEILFWPYVIIFSPRINICWAITSRSCIICFWSCANSFCPKFLYSLDLTTFFLFFMNFFILRKGTDAYDFTKKKIVYLIPFQRTEFSNSFCERFFTHPLFEMYSFNFSVIHFKGKHATTEPTLHHAVKKQV